MMLEIDAFTSELFKGNPACVMPLDSWLPDELLLNIAKENNVSETAFFVKKNNKKSCKLMINNEKAFKIAFNISSKTVKNQKKGGV